MKKFWKIVCACPGMRIRGACGGQSDKNLCGVQQNQVFRTGNN